MFQIVLQWNVFMIQIVLLTGYEESDYTGRVGKEIKRC